MEHREWVKGRAFSDYFSYNPRSGGIGKAASAFTIEIALDGANRSNTGWSISEVSTGSNAGLFTLDATTTAMNTTGVMQATVYETAAVSNIWEQTINLTTNGTPIGSSGTATWTATSGDGRIYDGSNAVLAATITFLNSSGTQIAEAFSSDSSGLYGPVHFPADDTYTASVSASGYVTQRFTVTVTSDVATGPGTDITLVAASAAGTTILASDMLAYAKRQFHDAAGNKADTIYYQAINRALTKIAHDKMWERYEEQSQLPLKGFYNTGTIAIAEDGTNVTLTGGTWPSWVSDEDELVINGKIYELSSRTSDTVVVLKEAWAQDAVTAASYRVERIRYALPADFQKFRRIYFGQNWTYGEYHVSLTRFQQQRDRYANTIASTSFVALGDGELYLWPSGSSNNLVRLTYMRYPTAITAASDTVDWYHQHRELLERAIDYQLSILGGCVAGTTEQCLVNYLEALETANFGQVEMLEWDPQDTVFSELGPDFTGSVS